MAEIARRDNGQVKGHNRESNLNFQQQEINRSVSTRFEQDIK
jgi:hypothetical protein